MSEERKRRAEQALQLLLDKVAGNHIFFNQLVLYLNTFLILFLITEKERQAAQRRALRDAIENAVTSIVLCYLF